MRNSTRALTGAPSRARKPLLLCNFGPRGTAPDIHWRRSFHTRSARWLFVLLGPQRERRHCSRGRSVVGNTSFGLAAILWQGPNGDAINLHPGGYQYSVC